MQPGIKVDLTQLNAATTSYAAATRKDLAYSANRAAKNVAFAAIKEVPIVTDSGVFERLADYEPLLGWTIDKLKREGRLPRLSAKRAREVARNNLTAGAAPIDPYREYAKNRIRARKARVGFMRGFFLRIAKEFQSLVPGGSLRAGAKGVPTMQPTIRPATPASLTVEMGSAYAFRGPTDGGKQQDTAHIERVLEAAIPPAIAKTIADMTAYTEKLLSSRARAISAAGMSS